jgi:ABC-2 type transport system permease protein
MTPRAFLTIVGSSARRVVADRRALAVPMGFYAIVVTVLGSLWRAAAENGGGQVVGYTAAALTWYIIASEAVTVAIPIRLIENIGDDIAGGAVATELLRPAPVLTVRMAATLGEALPRLGFCVVIGSALSLVTVGGPPRLATLPLAVVSMVLAIACNLVGQHAFAAAAFWIRDAKSTWFLYQKLVFIIGGMLLPLEVLPEWLNRTAMALPFMTMAYAPARLVAGHFEPWLLLVQLAWLAALSLAATAVFRSGERRLQVVGG